MTESETGTGYLLRKSSVSLAGQSVGTITALMQDAVVLACLGIGNETDALFAALAVPALITATLEVQLPKVLVPVVLRCASIDGSRRAAQVVTAIGVVLATLGAGLSLALLVWSSELSALQVPGFADSTKQTAASLAHSLVWLVPLRALATTLSSGLLARHSYAPPAFEKAVSQAVTVLWLTSSSGGVAISDVATGILLGAVASVAFLVVALVSVQGVPSLPRRQDIVAAAAALRLLPVPLIGQGIGEAAVLLENWLASYLGSGLLSSLRYATRISTAAGGMIVGSVVRAALPVVSAAVACADRERTSRRLDEALRLVLLFGAVMFVLFAFCGTPAVAVLFARGRFGPQETLTLSTLVLMFLPSIVLGRVLGVIQLPFYADLRLLPTLAGSAAALATYGVIGAPALRWAGVYGLPVARFLTSAAAVWITYVLVRHRFHLKLNWVSILSLPLRISLELAAWCLLGLGVTNLLPLGLGHTEWARLLVPGLAGTMGVLASTVYTVGPKRLKSLLHGGAV